MRNLTIDDMHAELRIALDQGKDLSASARDSLRDANQKCLDDIAFAIGKATRNEDESLIVRATHAPAARRPRGFH